MPFTDQDPIAPLENLLNQAVDEAVSTAGTNVDTLRPIRTFKWADSTERTAEVGMTAGDQGWQVDTKVQYTYSGTAWVITGGIRNIQLDTTNSTEFMVTQWGMGKIAGAAAASITEGVTFPVAFASVPFIGGAPYIGARTTSAFNPAGLVDINDPTVGKFFTPSTTGVQVRMHRTDGANLNSGWDYYYSWSATGVLA